MRPTASRTAEGKLREPDAPIALTDDALKVLHRERGYFTTNALRMQYPLFRRQGLPVGSGAVEGGAKHLVQQRMKRAGMRWSELIGLRRSKVDLRGRKIRVTE